MSGRWLELSVPRVMGILNVTPDSFSDGGLLSAGSASQFKVSLDKALFAVQSMVSAGADIID
ncbi:MAG: dihydropteroate synthase, partial [Pseudohongiella sp.]|nr:dihydropteroate synthase [Pseudohongiella sp.]